MYNDDIVNEIKRLKFEDLLWIIFIILGIINIYGDHNEVEYLETHNNESKRKANNFFTFTIIITILLYLYFVIRNYNFYKKASLEVKYLYSIKLLGSVLLIAGALCLLYFQINDPNFTGTPAL